jgi:hypothetical protein
MKRILVPTILAATFCTVIAVVPSNLSSVKASTAPGMERESSCSMQNVAGSYGYTSSGTIINPAVGPFAAVGKIVFNPSGTFNGAQTTSIAGNFFDETISGTFSVNSDCTATAAVNVYDGSVLARTTNLKIVFDDDRKGARAIFLTTGTVITVSARRIFGDGD